METRSQGPSSRLGPIVCRPRLFARVLMVVVCALPARAADGVLPQARVQALRQLVLNDCGSCHGLTLRGGLGPALRPELLAPKGQAYVEAMIREGNPANAMPAWKDMLSPSEVTWIAQSLIDGRLLPSEKP